MKENTQETQERKHKRRLASKIGFYLVNIILGLAILSILVGIGIFLLCGVKKVEVKGNTIYNEDEVSAFVLKDSYSKSNCVYAVLKNFFDPKKDIPFIDSAKVSMKNRNTLVITVKETPMTGFYTLSDGATFAYFDSKGVITDVSSLQVANVPALYGVTSDKAAIGESLPVDETDCKTIMSVFSELKKYNITTTAVTFGEEGALSAQYQNILINLGTRSDLDEKCKRLPYILPSLEGKSGTLHLENWTQENTDIIFQNAQ